MICYRGISFCSDSGTRCATTTCGRVYSDEERKRAEKWWGSASPPVAFLSFWDRCISKQPITADSFEITKGQNDDS